MEMPGRDTWANGSETAVWLGIGVGVFAMQEPSGYRAGAGAALGTERGVCILCRSCLTGHACSMLQLGGMQTVLRVSVWASAPAEGTALWLAVAWSTVALVSS